MQKMKIILSQPRGFCAGVERAIEIVELALKKYGAPIYVRHEIVHNKYVVDDLKSKGVIFVDEVSEIPDGMVTIFSAHGISEQVEYEASSRGLPIIDATCPLVTKVHREAQHAESQGKEVVLIGHHGHPEVEGTAGRVKGKVIIISKPEEVEFMQVSDPNNLAYVTQTTLSIDDTAAIISKLTTKFPAITGPNLKDICYATQNRQNALRQIAGEVDVILVIGAENSSNSNRLRDLGKELGIASYLIKNEEDLHDSWFAGKTAIGITAGASAPEILVSQVLERLGQMFEVTVSQMDGTSEQVRFKLPAEVL
jgi:4-hydroxy-3-methylbut-2-enyl diphosphate reductase